MSSSLLMAAPVGSVRTWSVFPKLGVGAVCGAGARIAFALPAQPLISGRTTCLPTSSFNTQRYQLASRSICKKMSIFFQSSTSFRQGNVPVGHRRRMVCSVAESESATETQTPVDTRMPVTVITGFLGSGKTTLLNHVLTANHGKRIAVIENEFGEVDVDGDIVASRRSGEEEILMLNNGCLCCTVRGDLVRMLEDLMTNKSDKFDHIIIETTGLANPAPIIQTFFLEERISDKVRLDGVVTMVDAKHVGQHLSEVKAGGVVNEAVEQIAYADRIILNKKMNGMATVRQAEYGVVDMEYVLGVGGFDLDRVEKEVDQSQPPLAQEHSHSHSDDEHSHGGDHSTHDHKHNHEHDHGHDHGPVHDHVHDSSVTSVSIVMDGDLDLEKINDWLGDLLADRSDDLYRMKGVLAIKDSDERFVFQGVHALFEGTPDRPWGDKKRTNRLVFIGKDLEEQVLRDGFKSCLVDT